MLIPADLPSSAGASCRRGRAGRSCRRGRSSSTPPRSADRCGREIRSRAESRSAARRRPNPETVQPHPVDVDVNSFVGSWSRLVYAMTRNIGDPRAIENLFARTVGAALLASWRPRLREAALRAPAFTISSSGWAGWSHGANILFDGERKFFARGVSYGPFAPNSRGERYPEPERAAADFALMRELGANVVRTYVPPPPWMFELAAKHDLRLMVGIPWPFHMAFLDSREMIRRHPRHDSQGGRRAAPVRRRDFRLQPRQRGPLRYRALARAARGQPFSPRALRRSASRPIPTAFSPIRTIRRPNISI